jgi:predicted dehydrogenase
MRCAIVGLGWWAGTLVDAVAGSESISFVAAVSRSGKERDREFANAHGLKCVASLEEALALPEVDAVILATPPAGHCEQALQAIAAGKHVFCEKPFTMTREQAAQVTEAAAAAGVALALGYNRRFHPSWIDLKERISSGELGTILHAECTMSGPNGLSLTEEAWRARPEDAPCGGLFPMGVHAVDGFIDLFGEIESAFCLSLRRAVPSDNDDTTSILMRMRSGSTAYLGTMMATVPSFRFQVYGSKASATLGGAVHVVGQSSHQRRSGLFGSYLLQPIKGDAAALEVPEFDVNRAELEAFAAAAAGAQPYPISHEQMVHGVAATEAIVRSARSGRQEIVA